MVKKVNITAIRLRDLKPYKNNAKIHTPEQIEHIKKSIERYDYLVPIIVDENNMILSGHGRYEALIKENNLDELVDCIVKKGLTDKQKQKFILEDNAINQETGFDTEILKEEFISIGLMEDIEEEILGFDQNDINKILNNIVDEEIPIEETEKTDFSLEEYEKIISLKCPSCGYTADREKFKG